MTGEHLTVATQGGEYSYHAEAARAITQDPDVKLDVKNEFGEVITASRNHFPGLGVIAITTAAGAVEKSAKAIVRNRPAALPPVVGRVDIEVELSLMGSRPQSLEELDRRNVHCLTQKEAWLQASDYCKEHLPFLICRERTDIRHESTSAIMEMVKRDDLDYVAIGPRFAAEALGAVIIQDRVNPLESITSFWVLQRDPRVEVLPRDSKKTAVRTILSLAHPEGKGELQKCWKLVDKLGIKIAQFTPFDIGDYTKHNPNLRRGGGLLEIGHDVYDEETTEFCARINGIKSNDGEVGPFDARKIGTYQWLPERYKSTQDLMEQIPA